MIDELTNRGLTFGPRQGGRWLKQYGIRHENNVEKTGSTIRPPPKTAILFNERFMAARQEERRYDTQLFVYFLVCKGLSNDGVGVARGTVFEEIRPGASFKTGDFVNEKLGGGYRRTTQKQGTWR